MPSEILSRIPLPSLRLYTSLSVLLVVGCVFYSFSVTSDPSWKQNVNITLHYPPPVSLDSVLPASEAGVHVGGGGGAPSNHELAFAAAEKMRRDGFAGDVHMTDPSDFRTLMDQLRDMMSFMGQEGVCIWVSATSVR